jgi:two-component system response regulator GlrR
VENALNVLVVDDDPSTVKLMVLWLTRQGFKARGFESAEEALAVAEDYAPDVLLTDLRLPGMGGFELLAMLRRRIPGLRAVAITGCRHDEFPDADVFDDFITKPVDLDRLTRTLHTAKTPRLAGR